MESAAIIPHLAPAVALICFPAEPNIPEGPDYK